MVSHIQDKEDESRIKEVLRMIINEVLNLSTAFILAFMTLLIIAAIMLAMDKEDTANSMAEYAYYFLVAGVILELIKMAIEGDMECSQEDNCS